MSAISCVRHAPAYVTLYALTVSTVDEINPCSSRGSGEQNGQVRRLPLLCSERQGWISRGIDILSKLAGVGAIVGTAVLLFGCSRMLEPERSQPKPPPPSDKVPNAPGPDNTIKDAPPERERERRRGGRGGAERDNERFFSPE